MFEECDLTKPGQVLVRLDTVTLDAELEESKASVTAAEEKLAIANAAIVRKKAEIELAKIEAERSRKLVEEKAGSQREYDVRKMSLETSTASLQEEEAKLQSAHQDVTVALANVKTIQTRIDDATLVSPVLGRVLYRLTEPGEVLAAGGKALTIVNLEDVYMEIFLPAEQAAAIKIGAEARKTPQAIHNRPRPTRGLTRRQFMAMKKRKAGKKKAAKKSRKKSAKKRSRPVGARVVRLPQ